MLLLGWFWSGLHPSLAHFTLSIPRFNDIQASFDHIESDNPPNRPRPILPEATDRHQPAFASATGQALRDLGYPSPLFPSWRRDLDFGTDGDIPLGHINYQLISASNSPWGRSLKSGNIPSSRSELHGLSAGIDAALRELRRGRNWHIVLCPAP